jgi:hypothetical protein
VRAGCGRADGHYASPKKRLLGIPRHRNSLAPPAIPGDQEVLEADIAPLRISGAHLEDVSPADAAGDHRGDPFVCGKLLVPVGGRELGVGNLAA